MALDGLVYNESSEEEPMEEAIMTTSKNQRLQRSRKLPSHLSESVVTVGNYVSSAKGAKGMLMLLVCLWFH